MQGARMGIKRRVWNASRICQNIAAKVNIHSNVIDCWSVLLNKLEESKADSSYYRLFFTIGTLRESMYDEMVNEDVRCIEFEVMVSSSIEDLTTDSELKNVDLVFFPIVDGNYYLICFNLKSFSILIIDQMRLVGTVESVYGNIPRVLKLRYKYLVRLLLSDHNILKCEFEKEYAKFVKMDKATRKKIVQGNLKVVFEADGN
ncbi:unnamed protein product [Lactuca virosa]|uniref:Uncharacterized protein n=1 Tax=Lactuca virosa TaxID=75947 RepID=A0AAU9LH63_9ASTR|nr:unnamed protein product [Lactuca virosa]